MDVGDLAVERHDRGRCQEVDGDQPGQVVHVAEIAPDGRQRARQNGVVERAHEHRQQHAEHDQQGCRCVRGVTSRRSARASIGRGVPVPGLCVIGVSDTVTLAAGCRARSGPRASPCAASARCRCCMRPMAQIPTALCCIAPKCAAAAGPTFPCLRPACRRNCQFVQLLGIADVPARLISFERAAMFPAAAPPRRLECRGGRAMALNTSRSTTNTT